MSVPPGPIVLVEQTGDTIVIEPTESLVTPVFLGRYRWWFVILLFLSMAGVVTLSVLYEPKLTTNHQAVTTLPKPTWWQWLLSAFLGIALGGFLAVYMMRSVHLDVVTPI
jgi:drug/metabolite transporter (DMT)-like permease